MRPILPLTIASWVLALLISFLTIVPPGASYVPGTRMQVILLGAAALFLAVGAVLSMFPRSAPKLSWRAQLGALAPLPALTLGFILAARGLLPSPILLLVFTILVGGGIWWWATRPSTTPEWRWGEAALGVILVPTIAVIGALMLFSVVGSTLMAIAVPNFGRMVQRAGAAEVLTQYRPGVDAATTFEGAGEALAEIVDTTVVRPILPGEMATWGGDSMMKRAAAGLTATERKVLADLVTDTDAPQVRTIAHAAALDPWGHLQLPIAAGANPYSLPIPKVMLARDAGRRHLYRAALALADRKPAVAESLAREVIGYGLRMRDDSDHLMGAMVGATIAKEGGRTLGVIWSATGRAAAADSLAARQLEADSAAPTIYLPGLEQLGGRSGLIALARDTAAFRAIRWEAIAILGLGRCTNLREAMFGPAPDLVAAYADGEASLVRNDRERAVFTVFQRGFQAPADGAGIPPFYKVVSWAVGPHLGACLSLANTAN